MYIFIGDETNVTQSKQAKFFIYGALLINSNDALLITNDIKRIRSNRGYKPADKFKFSGNSKPSQVDDENFIKAKKETLEVCHNYDVRFMAYAVHHSIARNQTQDDIWLWALNTLLCEFDLYLQRESSHGLCLVDRFEHDFSTLGKIHQKGIKPLVYGGLGGSLPRHLDNVFGYATICIDTIHLASLVDIVLGSFRYCVNKTRVTPLATELYKMVRPLILTPPGDTSLVENWGLFLRPKEVKVPEYRKEYEELRDKLKSFELRESI